MVKQGIRDDHPVVRIERPGPKVVFATGKEIPKKLILLLNGPLLGDPMEKRGKLRIRIGAGVKVFQDLAHDFGHCLHALEFGLHCSE